MTQPTIYFHRSDATARYEVREHPEREDLALMYRIEPVAGQRSEDPLEMDLETLEAIYEREEE